MEFIDMEATEDSQENQPLAFSDDDEEMTNDAMENFIKFDPDNLKHYRKFPNETRDSKTAIYEDDEMYLGEEDFLALKNLLKNSRKTLKNFENSDNPFF